MKVCTGRLFAVLFILAALQENLQGANGETDRARLPVSLFILKLGSLVSRIYSFQPVNGQQPLTIFDHFHLGGNEP